MLIIIKSFSFWAKVVEISNVQREETFHKLSLKLKNIQPVSFDCIKHQIFSNSFINSWWAFPNRILKPFFYQSPFGECTTLIFIDTSSISPREISAFFSSSPCFKLFSYQNCSHDWKYLRIILLVKIRVTIPPLGSKWFPFEKTLLYLFC